MKTVREFTNQIQAALLQSVLRDNEIDAVLLDEHAAAWARAPLLIPIRLQVPDEQLAEAMSLIAEFDASPESSGDVAAEPPI